MTNILLAINTALLFTAVLMLIMLIKRGSGAAGTPAQFDSLEKGQERSERTMREETQRNREEINTQLKAFNDSIRFWRSSKCK